MIYNGYELDPFQEEACQAIAAGHSVIVAAPTGAGKTVIAEYAVEACLKLSRRVIYTAPIKALSNQKYRDFRVKFGENVGIVTGDVVINAFAPVLVMTTEIFRNTIFDEVSRLYDVEYVIFDEIHYINDIERGTVWEESIIFAPQNIKFVCLSATIPNLRQFSDWIQSVRETQIDVIQESNRPVPLEHEIYMPGFGVGTLDDLKRISQMLERQREHSEEFDKNNPPKATLPETQTVSLIQHLADNARLPCLYFCFSRRGCEERALFYSEESFLTPLEEDEILKVYDSLCQTFDLRDDFRAQEFRNLIRAGVAYHHAGMLPTLKEVVERLFTLGLIQLLFTTETFAVGINMPARTVVFDSVEKYDGISFRYLKAREYQQMAGRAGRRGIDPVGYVYATVNPGDARVPQVEHLLTGEPEAIESQFNLSYSSILNLLEEHGDRMFDICRKSFGNYQSFQLVRNLKEQVKRHERTQGELPEPECIYPNMHALELLTGYRNLSLDVQVKLQDVRSLKTQAKRRYSGRKKKRDRIRKLGSLDRQAAMIQEELSQALCHGCRNFRTCRERFDNLERNRTKISDLHERIQFTENYQRAQIDNRLKLLGSLDYIEGNDILPRGFLAKQIYGYEIQVTQLVFGGYFERLTPDELNVLVVSMVFEAKKDEWYRRLDDGHLKGLLRAASDEIERVREQEAHFGVDTYTQSLDTKLATATLAWSRGCEFDELRNYASSPEGDLVRVFRSGADLLRQMRRALREHPTLPERLSESIRRLNRDIVDAERQLRAELRATGLEPEGDGNGDSGK